MADAEEPKFLEKQTAQITLFCSACAHARLFIARKISENTFSLEDSPVGKSSAKLIYDVENDPFPRNIDELTKLIATAHGIFVHKSHITLSDRRS